MTPVWTDCTWDQHEPCMVTHCVLVLLTGSTVQAVCPSLIWWVLEVIAGLKGDWNSHPQTVSSVWPSGGAVRGKNCINKAEYIPTNLKLNVFISCNYLCPPLQTKPHPSYPRRTGLIPPAAVALTLPGAYPRAPATTHELWGCQAHSTSHEVLTTRPSLGNLNHL